MRRMMVLAAAVLGLATGARAQTAWDGVFSGDVTLQYESVDGNTVAFDPFTAAFSATGVGSTDAPPMTSSPVAVTLDITGAESVAYVINGHVFGPDFASANPDAYGFVGSTFDPAFESFDVSISSQGSHAAFDIRTVSNGHVYERFYDSSNVTYTGDDKPNLPPGPAPEPTTWALLMAGVGVAGWALRRRHCSAAQRSMRVFTAAA